jgi:hypothetical protein
VNGREVVAAFLSEKRNEKWGQLHTQTHIHELGNLIEFMAIGTAVKRVAGIATVSPTLPPQAIIKDRDTWISSDDNLFGSLPQGQGES